MVSVGGFKYCTSKAVARDLSVISVAWLSAAFLQRLKAAGKARQNRSAESKDGKKAPTAPFSSSN